MQEWRKVFEAEDSDFGGMGALGGLAFWEREITDLKPTETDHDQSRYAVTEDPSVGGRLSSLGVSRMVAQWTNIGESPGLGGRSKAPSSR